MTNPSNISIPQEVIEKDQKLEAAAERSTEALAKHRWHWTLDISNSGKTSFRAYAKAIGRGEATVRTYANGYKLMVERAVDARPGRALSIQDAIRLSGQSAEKQEFSEAIAEGSGEPVANVARGDNRSTDDIISQAKQRADRKGTDPVDEAKDIAKRRRQTREMADRQRKEKAEAKSIRFVEIEGDLAYAQRRLTNALQVAQDVGFSDEEMELLRDSLGKIRALLTLLDLRMAGTLNVDWDAELEKITGAAS
jgi:hypothetical protein